ncbi:MAG: hypothetical protein OEV42_19600, partial [Deltaproteobacteria bacterium]|nr:hypothetical protein [Deltaproteobacteria bacterium]
FCFFFQEVISLRHLSGLSGLGGLSFVTFLCTLKGHKSSKRKVTLLWHSLLTLTPHKGRGLQRLIKTIPMPALTGQGEKINVPSKDMLI